MPEVTFRIGRTTLAGLLAHAAGFDALDGEWLRLAEAAGAPLADYERPYWDDASETYRFAPGASSLRPRTPRARCSSR